MLLTVGTSVVQLSKQCVAMLIRSVLRTLSLWALLIYILRLVVLIYFSFVDAHCFLTASGGRRLDVVER